MVEALCDCNKTRGRLGFAESPLQHHETQQCVGGGGIRAMGGADCQSDACRTAAAASRTMPAPPLALPAALARQQGMMCCRFMAPEVMSSEVYPSSDIWAAGVMTYQLLTGQMPFDDRRRPNSPALSAIW